MLPNGGMKIIIIKLLNKSWFGTVTERDFIEIQIVWNAKEHDWEESVCWVVINVLRSLNIYFPVLEELTGRGLENVAYLNLGFMWPFNY
jgi:hypothetical protein